jgi:hypothetical protein
MNTFTTITFGFFLLAGAVNIYLGVLYLKLFQEGISITYRRISLKILNTAIRDKANEPYLAQLIYCKKVYIIWLTLVWCCLFLIGITVYGWIKQ